MTRAVKPISAVGFFRALVTRDAPIAFSGENILAIIPIIIYNIFTDYIIGGII